VQDEKPSATAWRVALGRAAHQIYDTPRIFDDPLALRIVGACAHGQSPQTFFSRRYKRSIRTTLLRAILAVRSRIAEDELAAAVTRGVRQYVVLGAGLDTFAYRNPHSGVRVFEVDHPATQAWKRKILGLERQTAMAGLIAAGFDASTPAFFAWLGVTMYLPEETLFAVLRAIAALPPASGVVFDYAIAKNEMTLLVRMAVAAVNQRLKQIGEPWVTFFSPGALAEHLNALGFQRIRNLGSEELNAEYFSGRTDGLRVSSVAHVMIASV
jgi:methyltransferase (TIGR00027 family)